MAASPDISGPYEASPARREQILDGLEAVSVGMPRVQVHKIMGPPDETHPVFDKDDWDQQIGESDVYLLSRKSRVGSVSEREEHLVRIIVSMDDERVTKVDQW
jgi:hypothetical protein